MRNLFKALIGVVAFLFCGINLFAAAIFDGLACAACSQHMCQIHTSGHKGFKQYASAVKSGQTENVPADVKEKVDKDKERERKREAELFKKFDVNKDGKLDKQEQIELFKHRLQNDQKFKERVFARFDSDTDGKLSDGEIEKAIEFFKQLHPKSPNREPKKQDPDQVVPVSPSEPKTVPPDK